MKRKILCFIGAPYVSGLEIVTLHLLVGLKKRGYSIFCIINGWNDGVFKQKLIEQNIEFQEVKLGWIYITKPLWTLDSLWHYPSAYFKIRKIFKTFKPDVCHFSNFPSYVMIYPLLKVPAVYNLQETHLPSKKHLSIYKWLNMKISFFTAVSNHIVRVLENLNIPREKIALIYNGVPVINEHDLNESTRKQTGEIMFGVIGQVAAWKGLTTVLNAVELLTTKSIVDFKVLIFGNDNNDYGKELKNAIEQKGLSSYFVWKGFVSSQSDIYPHVDVVLVPSLSEEPCSLTIIESMMRSKAVIASDRGGNVELVENGFSGLIFEAESAISLSDKMEALLSGREKISAFAANSYRVARTKLTVERMVDEYSVLYDKC